MQSAVKVSVAAAAAAASVGTMMSGTTRRASFGENSSVGAGRRASFGENSSVGAAGATHAAASQWQRRSSHDSTNGHAAWTGHSHSKKGGKVTAVSMEADTDKPSMQAARAATASAWWAHNNEAACYDDPTGRGDGNVSASSGHRDAKAEMAQARAATASAWYTHTRSYDRPSQTSGSGDVRDQMQVARAATRSAWWAHDQSSECYDANPQQDASNKNTTASPMESARAATASAWWAHAGEQYCYKDPTATHGHAVTRRNRH